MPPAAFPLHSTSSCSRSCFLCVGWTSHGLLLPYAAPQAIVAGATYQVFAFRMWDLVAAVADARVFGTALHGAFSVVALKVG